MTEHQYIAKSEDVNKTILVKFYQSYRSLSQVAHPAVQERRSSQLRRHICDQIVIEHWIVVVTSSRFPVVRVASIFRAGVTFRAPSTHFT
jgi:hypothetical protein